MASNRSLTIWTDGPKTRLSRPLWKEKLRSPTLGTAHPPRSPRSGR